MNGKILQVISFLLVLMMNVLRKSGTLLILAGLTAPLFSPAFAQTSGQFTLTGSYNYSYKQVQHGNTTFTAGSLKGADIVASGQGALFPQGKTFLRSCVVFSEQSADDFSLKGPCTFKESEEDGGDEVFISYIREQGDLGAANRGGMGRIDLVGGTGKYTGVTGQCSYETRYLSADTGILTADCNWSKS